MYEVNLNVASLFQGVCQQISSEGSRQIRGHLHEFYLGLLQLLILLLFLLHLSGKNFLQVESGSEEEINP